MAEPHNLPNPADALVGTPTGEEAGRTCGVDICNRRRRRRGEPEEAAGAGNVEKKRFGEEIMNLVKHFFVKLLI